MHTLRTWETAISEVYRNGEARPDRTGIGTHAVFGRHIRVNLDSAMGGFFPLTPWKQTSLLLTAGELKAFLNGATNIAEFEKYGVGPWWRDFVKDKETGEIGPIYGAQWRSWMDVDGNAIDQIDRVIHGIKTNPFSRRHVVSAWNVGDLPEMGLPPCHMKFQFFVSSDGKLSCSMNQRSADMFLGVPYNQASYALLTHMIAQQCGLGVGHFLLELEDAHIYDNHRKAVRELMSRPRLPYGQLIMPKHAPKSIDGYEPDDFKMDAAFISHGKIKAPLAVGAADTMRVS